MILIAQVSEEGLLNWGGVQILLGKYSVKSDYFVKQDEAYPKTLSTRK
jgi:hypothetical protein